MNRALSIRILEHHHDLVLLWIIWKGYGMYMARGTPGWKHLISGSRSIQCSRFSFFLAAAQGRYGNSLPSTTPRPPGTQPIAPSPTTGAARTAELGVRPGCPTIGRARRLKIPVRCVVGLPDTAEIGLASDPGCIRLRSRRGWLTLREDLQEENRCYRAEFRAIVQRLPPYRIAKTSSSVGRELYAGVGTQRARCSRKAWRSFSPSGSPMCWEKNDAGGAEKSQLPPHGPCREERPGSAAHAGSAGL